MFPQKVDTKISKIVYNTTQEENYDKEKKDVYEGVQDRSGSVTREKRQDSRRPCGGVGNVVEQLVPLEEEVW
jgi:hypothetical protein